ncbi:MAG: hypothetical protein CM1200mP20_07670 [Pseudomonadota bacterium]|nr:MAG: hypothetical protein CM1200mP20_07670 [Pseudomonadota bacterium]
MPILTPDEQAESKLAMLRQHLTAFGRDPDNFGIEGWLRMNEADPDQWSTGVEGWRRLGPDIVMLYPMYRTPNLDDQIQTLRTLKGKFVTG